MPNNLVEPHMKIQKTPEGALFGRRYTVETDGSKITGALQMKLKASKQQAADDTLDVLSIYNLSTDTKAKFKEGAPISIEYGYPGSPGELSGFIAKIEDRKMFGEPDQEFRVLILPYSPTVYKEKMPITTGKGLNLRDRLDFIAKEFNKEFKKDYRIVTDLDLTGYSMKPEKDDENPFAFGKSFSTISKKSRTYEKNSVTSIIRRCIGQYKGLYMIMRGESLIISATPHSRAVWLRRDGKVKTIDRITSVPERVIGDQDGITTTSVTCLASQSFELNDIVKINDQVNTSFASVYFKGSVNDNGMYRVIGVQYDLDYYENWQIQLTLVDHV